MLNRRRRSSAPDAALPPAVVLPGAEAGTWEVCRPGTLPRARQTFASLEAVAGALVPGEMFRLELPVDAGLIQRLSLPPADVAELEDMARIQLEKILPYPSDAMGMTFQVISTTETEAVLAVEAVHHERLLAICQPLTSRGCWPSQVTFHALALASSVPLPDASALVFQEDGKVILVICEHGHMSFAQSLGNRVSAESVAAGLPAVLLGAELEGVSVGVNTVRLDKRRPDLAAALEDVFQAPVEIATSEIDCGSSAEGDLSPGDWQAERLRSARSERIKRRLWIAGGIYLGALLLAFVLVVALKFQVARYNAQLRAGGPDQEFILAAETKWKSLAPATQPPRFVAEVLFQVCECLPPNDLVQLTAFDLTTTTLAVQGEAPSPASAVDFTEKLKVRPELKMFRFEASPPSTLPSGRARFSVSGRVNG